MKVLFLDFDGVLNCDKYFAEGEIDMPFFDERCMKNLTRIIKETGAKIVLSTTWREYWEKSESECKVQGLEINRIFDSYGLKITDKTDDVCFYDRGAEIALWMMEREDVTGFAVLDDMQIEGIPPRHVIKTDGKTGLTPDDAERAISVLNE